MSAPLPEQSVKLSLVDYLAFIDTRPGSERWQLIDGVAMLMPRPTLRHQRIASNLCNVLTEHFEARRLDLLAIFRIGLIVPGAELFRPLGDVVVADECKDQIDTAFVDRFYLVAEVLSDGDMEKDIPAKSPPLHSASLEPLLPSRRAETGPRRGSGTCSRVGADHPEGLDAVLELPEWGFCATLADLYRGTSLAPAA